MIVTDVDPRRRRARRAATLRLECVGLGADPRKVVGQRITELFALRSALMAPVTNAEPRRWR